MTALSESRQLGQVEICEAQTSMDRAAVFGLRRQVFRDEQHLVSGSVEDADDGRSVLVLARWHRPEGPPLAAGTGRLTLGAGPAGEAIVTWVATRRELRGHGIGTAVMRHLLDIADRRQAPAVILAAQAPAIAFYQRLGFVPDGKWYLVTGVQHLPMRRVLPRATEAPLPVPLEWW